MIAATGVLHHPNLPGIAGLDRFEGALFHSARWDHGVRLDGRSLGDHRHRLDGDSDRLGARRPRGEAVALPAHRAVDHAAGEPGLQRGGEGRVPAPPGVDAPAARGHLAAVRGGLRECGRRRGSPQMKALDEACRANLENNVRDPELREKLRPSYRAACKRLIMSPDFYEAIQKPNAELVTEGIERVEPRGRAHARRAPASSSTCSCSQPASASIASCGRCASSGAAAKPRRASGPSGRSPTCRSRSRTSRTSSC